MSRFVASSRPVSGTTERGVFVLVIASARGFGDVHGRDARVDSGVSGNWAHVGRKGGVGKKQIPRLRFAKPRDDNRKNHSDDKAKSRCVMTMATAIVITTCHEFVMSKAKAIA